MSPYLAESSRLFLQELDEEEHLHGYHEIMSDPRSMMWSEKTPTTTIAESLESMRKFRPTLEQPWHQRWGIMLKTDDPNLKPKMVGLIGIPREAEIGYRIHPGYWGKGYMSEALTMFIKMWWAMESNKKYAQMLAAADPENTASTRILIKHGFQKGAYKKDYYTRSCLGGEVKSDLQFFYLDRPREVDGD